MADNDNEKLVIEIELEEGKILKGFLNVKDIAATEGKKAGSSFGNNLTEAASSAASKLKGVLLGATAAISAAFATSALISAASENERAILKLNGALRATGDFSPQISEQLQSYAGNLSRLTTISGSAILEQVALAKQLGATTDQAKRITTAAADMSAALGISFESSVSTLTRTLNGNAGALTKVIPELKNFTEEQLKAGAAIDIVSRKFEGLAGANTSTFTGALAGLQNSFGNLVEEVGKLIIKSPVIIATFNVLSKYIDQVTDSVSGLVGDKKGLNGASFAAIEFGKAIVNYVVAPLELLYNIGKTVFNVLATGLATIVQGMGMALGGLANLANKFGVDNDLTKGLQLFAESSKEVADDLYIDTQKSFEKIFDFDFSTRAMGVVEEIESVTKQIADKTQSAVVNTGEKITNVVNKTSAEVKRLQGILQNGLTRVVGTSMEALGASLVVGGDAFSNFGATIIGITGDLASQLGTAYIAIGIGIEAIGKSAMALTGGPAIAAGIALLILGGALKAFAKKGGSTANTNSVGPQTGGDSYGSAECDSLVTKAPETQQERNPEVNIIVQGSIFDSGETGRRLVDIINGAYDKEGVKIRKGAVA